MLLKKRKKYILLYSKIKNNNKKNIYNLNIVMNNYIFNLILFFFLKRGLKFLIEKFLLLEFYSIKLFFLRNKKIFLKFSFLNLILRNKIDFFFKRIISKFMIGHINGTFLLNNFKKLFNMPFLKFKNILSFFRKRWLFIINYYIIAEKIKKIEFYKSHWLVKLIIFVSFL